MTTMKRLLGFVDSPSRFVRLGSAALLGVATGCIGVAAMMTSAQLGAAHGPELFGVCIGWRFFGKCTPDWGSYLFPGLTFGLVFGGVLLRARRLRVRGVVGFWVGTVVAHAAAVTATLNTFDLLGDAVSGRLRFAIGGVVGGAVGGGMLALIARGLLKISRWPQLMATGSLLGLLLPLLDWAGLFGFYALWQAGYAATLTNSLPKVGAVPRK